MVIKIIDISRPKLFQVGTGGSDARKTENRYLEV